MDPGALDQPGADAEPARRVVVPGDHHGRHAGVGEPVQRLVEQLDGGQRRHGPVVDVSCDQDRVDVALAHRRHQVVEERGLGVEQAHPVERPPQVPVRRVQESHDPREYRWGRTSPGGFRRLRTSGAPYASPPSSSPAVPAVASASQPRKASTSASGSPISMVTASPYRTSRTARPVARRSFSSLPARWWSTVTVASRKRCRVRVPSASRASPTDSAVRPDQPARAELHTAVVAGDDGDDVPDLAAHQHLQHGHARRAAGFAVVARLLHGGVGADDVREAVVGGGRVLLADACDEGLRLLLGRGGRERADEARSVDLGLVHALAGDRPVLLLHPATLCGARRGNGTRRECSARAVRCTGHVRRRRDGPQDSDRATGDTWAVVGLSGNESRAAYGVAGVLQRFGKRVVPVHPKAETVHGEQGYASLADIPFPVDVVDVFVNCELAGAVADEAVGDRREGGVVPARRDRRGRVRAHAGAGRDRVRR